MYVSVDRTLHITAEELRPEHLGHDITVAVGLEREGLYLTAIRFYADRDNTASGFRVVVVDANPTRSFDLASYAKVEVIGWEDETLSEDEALEVSRAHSPKDWFTRGVFPSCSCGYAPGDNAFLTAHWAGLGIQWADHRGQLVWAVASA